MDESNSRTDNEPVRNQTGDTRPAANANSPEKGTPTSFCCHGLGPEGRNLVVCIDGTANQFGYKNTNVIELYSLILKDRKSNQLTWYNSGIGTYARPSWRSLAYLRSVIDHKIDLAIAWNFERTILAAYRWLSENYVIGDRIFLYGFSRGAFQVRVLSAMIDKVGLIHKGNEEQIPFAYQLYADPKSSEPTRVPVVSKVLPEKPTFATSIKNLFTQSQSTPMEEGEPMAARFKSTFSHPDVRVHFVGVWDTVSSIGIIREKTMPPGTIDGMKHVCLFRQALALDELRVKFLPEYAYGGSATDPLQPNPQLDNNQSHRSAPDKLEEHTTTLETPKYTLVGKSEEDHADNAPPIQDSHRGLEGGSANEENLAGPVTRSELPPPHTLEVWFAGTHSDIGGGNQFNAAMDRSRPPLRWMVFESLASGLRTRLFDRPLSAKEQIDVEESLTGSWKVLEWVPFRRLTYTRDLKEGKQTTHKPHWGAPRKIHDAQKIHGSILRTDSKYTPKARPPVSDPELWENMRNPAGLGNWQAVDLYEATEALVRKSIQPDQGTDMDAVWSDLQKTAMASGDGRQAVYESVVNALSRTTSIDIKHRLIAKATDILLESNREHMNLKLFFFTEFRESMADLCESNNEVFRSDTKKFIHHFVNHGPIDMKGHTNPVTSVTLSSDGKQIISGSWDNTLRIWDSQTGAPVGEPLRGHTDWVRSVAISPNGKLIASGSDDRTVRIWDASTRKPVGKPFEGHTSEVFSVSFSPDSKHVASGSRDHTIRIWDVEKGKCVGEPLQGHPDVVNTVAYSPDGKYLALGSNDFTVHIWDAVTREPAGELAQAHISHIYSVAFSPDSSRIASGSRDRTVCIWDVATRTVIGKAFQGHTGLVRSVAFSPDGQRIASGSLDGRGLVWDVETREIQYTFPHKDVVRSVAFSPDGKSVVSGCDDGVVRVWDVELW